VANAVLKYRDRIERFIHISTSEVYGTAETPAMHEDHPLKPLSPYAAAKCGADRLVWSYFTTYDIPAVIIRPFNNYGPRQHPEKLIPLTILNSFGGDPIPVYGDGMQVRNWLFVEDFCSAIRVVLAKGEAGEVYNVGGPDELPNIEVVKTILRLAGGSEDTIEHVEDRLGHDRRYSLSSSRTEGLGWKAEVPFEEGIARTVEWYRDNPGWWESIRSGEYLKYYIRHYGLKLKG
jgi:dTDP-glucose 4,6-dehydratase